MSKINEQSKEESSILNSESNIYKFDEKANDNYIDAKPWMKDDLHFKKVYISTLAAMKITEHAIRGGKFEIAGYLIGFAKNGIFYVLDSVELPIIGTDSRVEIAQSMGDKTIEYMLNYKENLEKVGRQHVYVGWYSFSSWLWNLVIRN